jgi:hypothetical protein
MVLSPFLCDGVLSFEVEVCYASDLASSPWGRRERGLNDKRSRAGCPRAVFVYSS